MKSTDPVGAPAAAVRVSVPDVASMLQALYDFPLTLLASANVRVGTVAGHDRASTSAETGYSTRLPATCVYEAAITEAVHSCAASAATGTIGATERSARIAADARAADMNREQRAMLLRC
jgi:hypothetical protein